MTLHELLNYVVVLATIMGLAGGFAACALWTAVDEFLKKKDIK